MEDEIVVENTQEELDAAFEQGLKGQLGEVQEVAEPVEEVEETVSEELESVDDTGSEISAGEEPVEDIIAGLGLTATEVKAMLAKTSDIAELRAQLEAEKQKIYGKFGDISRKLQPPSGRKLTPEDFKSLNAAGYDDITEDLAKDLSELALVSGYDAEPLRQEFAKIIEDQQRSSSEKLQNLSKELNIDILSIKHPDFAEKWKSQDMQLWFNTLPGERQNEIKASNNGRYLSATMDEFVEWKGRGQKSKNDRLERAITPKGSPPEPKRKQPTEKQAFEQGLLNAQRRLGIKR